ncbi:MAG: ATP-binding cassette domain-containing protein [Spirochaetota bacterium]
MDNNDFSSLIKLVDIHKHFGGVVALEGINFEVGTNEVVGLVGDNGAGKSTMIKIIMGVHKPDKGEIYFKDKKVEHWNVEKARESGVEVVYQEKALGEKQPVWSNIFMGRELVGALGFLKIKAAKEETERIMKRYIGFTSSAVTPDSFVRTMSGGEQQGVAIARALYFNAELIILDEPTTALSIYETKKVLNFIQGIKESGRSAVVISHAIYHLYPVSDRFVILDRGKIVGEFKKAEISLDELIDELQKVASTGHI